MVHFGAQHETGSRHGPMIVKLRTKLNFIIERSDFDCTTIFPIKKGKRVIPSCSSLAQSWCHRKVLRGSYLLGVVT